MAFVDLRPAPFDFDIYVQVYDANLGLLAQHNIDTGVNFTFDPAITYFTSGAAAGSYVISYTIGSGDDTDIVGRIVSSGGAVGGPFEIGPGTDNRG